MRKITLITIITATCLTSALVASSVRELLYPTIEAKEVVNPKLFSEYLETKINRIRGSELKHSETLCEIGKERIADLKTTGFSHDKFNEKSQSWMEHYKYMRLGENLRLNMRDLRYMSYSDIAEPTQAWLNSPSHYENIMKPEYNETCVVCSDAYCAQIFAESPPAKPE